jgi:hypothetical protein
MIGEGMGEWLKPLLGHKRGWGVVKKSFFGSFWRKKNIGLKTEKNFGFLKEQPNTWYL